MNEIILSGITAFGTLGAVFVALLLAIAPAIIAKNRRRRIAFIKIRNGLWISHEALRGYFFYNPIKIIIENEIYYSFNKKNTEYYPDIDIKSVVYLLYDSVVELDGKMRKKILSILNNIELLFSGLPQHNRAWISIDNELIEIRNIYFKDNRISQWRSVQEIFAETENIQLHIENKRSCATGIF